MFALFYAGGMPALGSLFTMLLRFDNPSRLIAYFLVGGFFGGLVFSVWVVSIPLMLDRDQNAITSMIASFLALARNPLVLLFWGFLILLLIGFGILLGYLGLIVTGPLAGHATWHAFRALLVPVGLAEIGQGYVKERDMNYVLASKNLTVPIFPSLPYEDCACMKARNWSAGRGFAIR